LCANFSNQLSWLWNGVIQLPELGYGHGGDGTGISVKCYSDPANNITVFILTNCWNFKNGEDDMSLLQKQAFLMHNLMFETKKLVLRHYK
jgi:hypothetical protein